MTEIYCILHKMSTISVIMETIMETMSAIAMWT